jgi:hypothetical protein
MALDDPEVGEQERDRLRGHRCAPVGMDGERVGLDALLGDGVGDEAWRRWSRRSRTSPAAARIRYSVRSDARYVSSSSRVA